MTAAADRTVIELNRIQRGLGESRVEPEVQKQLDRTTGSSVFMHKLDVEERDGQVEFRFHLWDLHGLLPGRDVQDHLPDLFVLVPKT